MGMFDSLYDSRAEDGVNHEWQTKAYDCTLERFDIGDPVPAIPTEYLTDYQVAILGGPRDEHSLATVRDGILVAVHVARDESLPRLDYFGNIIEQAAVTL